MSHYNEESYNDCGHPNWLSTRGRCDICFSACYECGKKVTIDDYSYSCIDRERYIFCKICHLRRTGRCRFCKNLLRERIPVARGFGPACQKCLSKKSCTQCNVTFCGPDDNPTVMLITDGPKKELLRHLKCSQETCPICSKVIGPNKSHSFSRSTYHSACLIQTPCAGECGETIDPALSSLSITGGLIHHSTCSMKKCYICQKLTKNDKTTITVGKNREEVSIHASCKSKLTCIACDELVIEQLSVEGGIHHRRCSIQKCDFPGCDFLLGPRAGYLRAAPGYAKKNNLGFHNHHNLLVPKIKCAGCNNAYQFRPEVRTLPLISQLFFSGHNVVPSELRAQIMTFVLCLKRLSQTNCTYAAMTRDLRNTMVLAILKVNFDSIISCDKFSNIDFAIQCTPTRCQKAKCFCGLQLAPDSRDTLRCTKDACKRYVFQCTKCEELVPAEYQEQPDDFCTPLRCIKNANCMNCGRLVASLDGQSRCTQGKCNVLWKSLTELCQIINYPLELQEISDTEQRVAFFAAAFEQIENHYLDNRAAIAPKLTFADFEAWLAMLRRKSQSRSRN